jgi:hypothetical protein
VAKPYEVSLVSNTRGFVQGLDQAGDAVEKIGDSLDDVATVADKSGKKAGDSLADGIDRGTKDAIRSEEKLERSFRDLADEASKRSRDAGDDIDKNIRRGTAGASEGIRDFKQEAKQNAEEVATSFDGSADSIKDGFQSVAATAFAGFGPAGAVAGLAAAAGIGLIGTAFENQGEKAEELAQKSSDMADRIIESGGRVLTAELEQETISEAARDPKSWEKILAIQKATQVTIGEATRAVALEGAERNKVLDILGDINDANADLTMSGSISLEQATLENDKARELIGYLDEQNAAADIGYTKAMAIDQATGGLIAKRSQERDLVQDRNRALTNTPTTVNTKLVVDDSDLVRKLSVQKSINVVLQAVDKFGKKVS